MAEQNTLEHAWSGDEDDDGAPYFICLNPGCQYEYDRIYGAGNDDPCEGVAWNAGLVPA